jgi:intracellular sulfur oxidation DsrE/DsrF family protein
MKTPTRYIFAALMLAVVAAPVTATEPNGYAPAKVVYDVSSADPVKLLQILDRVSLLQTIYNSDPFAASIVIVIHEGAIPLLANSARKNHPELANRAQGLAMGEVIQFRLCQASAKMQGYARKDFEDFIKLVPMADAEIVRLQHDGYAYLH